MRGPDTRVPRYNVASIHQPLSPFVFPFFFFLLLLIHARPPPASRSLSLRPSHARFRAGVEVGERRTEGDMMERGMDGWREWAKQKWDLEGDIMRYRGGSMPPCAHVP
ncbi:hypothetical protein B0H14DRAFT_1326312 [Mycena olivaceomarginata]|nr:hypothetical protein B0H14DRAFT_1326312 [Mycena olivaceomarginata]